MDVQKTVINIIAENLSLKPEDIKLNSDLIADLKADSLDVVQIIMSLEDKFDISILDEDAENIPTIKHIIDYITEKKK